MAVSEFERKWTEKDGVIRFSVKSNGFSGKQWLAHFKEKGSNIYKWAKSLISAKKFNDTVTSDITYNIAVLKWELFEGNERTYINVSKDAERRELEIPKMEIACLIRDEFTDEELKKMGLWWLITMHEPEEDFDGYLGRLGSNRYDDVEALVAFDGSLGHRLDREVGFAFVVSQADSEDFES